MLSAQYEVYADWIIDGKVEVYFDQIKYPGFFAWVIPSGNGVGKVGVAGREINVSKTITDFLKNKGKYSAVRKIFAPIWVKGPIKKFVSDYIIDPTPKKAYCDKKSIKKYGLMPPIQLNTQEAQEVAKYIYNKYNPKEFYKIQQERIKFNSLPKAEQLAIKYGCFSCHQKEKPKLAPSFKTISQRSSIQTIKNSIINGSKGKYKNFKIPRYNPNES